MAEWWYNSTYDSSLEMTPFEALFGYKLVPLSLGPYLESVVPAASDMIQERNRIANCIKDNLAKAQQRMKYFADQHRTEREFAVVRKCLKLSAKFFGPFQVEEKIGSVAYKLKLPVGTKLHLVFHVSLLKKKLGPLQNRSTKLPELDTQDQCPLQPELILKRRAIMRGGQPVIQLLIKWNQLDYEEASWEDKSFIEHQFPTFQT
ncbi:uncharacterized protein [Coffea arabica]|uniref:Chromo domain-containing protein n=1 Tax=Coffea arabica TaxID=13443 RepID=A0ABM4UF94_COFAR